MIRSIPRWLTILCCLLIPMVLTPARAADDPGLAELDEATQLKLSAKSFDDLGKVADKCEAALAKGLSDDNRKFAVELITSSLFQRATAASQAIFGPTGPGPRWPEIRRLAMADLERALKHDANFGSAHLLIGRLEALPRGDRNRAQKAFDEAVKHAAGDEAKVEALLYRAGFSEDADKRLADYNEAARLAPKSVDVLRARGMFFLERNQHDAALADLKAVAELDAMNPAAHEALGGALLMLNKTDDAIASYTKAIELVREKLPAATVGLLVNRARAYAVKNDLAKAIADLSDALKRSPNDLPALLLRGRIYLAEKEYDKAGADAQKMLTIRPGLIAAIELQASIAAAQGRYQEAIDTLEMLNKDKPGDKERLLQLAGLYSAWRKPRMAVQRYSDVIQLDPKDWLAWYGRADSLLGIGKHEEALADYNKAYELKPDHSGILNNLAWLLATSPIDKVRNGKRSIEIGKKACELTEYKRPHILSTLAAGYAETGDWENAVKWSTKALEICEEDDDNRPQLTQELESYKQKKPWREMQNIEEEEKQKSPKSEPKGNDKQKDKAKPAPEPKPMPDPKNDDKTKPEPPQKAPEP